MPAKQRSRKWSAAVTHGSNALDLESGVFTSGDAHRIALSLKRSALRSRRRKGTPFQSAMSMLNFYINRAGSGLSARQKKPWRTPGRSCDRCFIALPFPNVLERRKQCFRSSQPANNARLETIKLHSALFKNRKR
jgi:Protein of unknown function (DUF3175)